MFRRSANLKKQSTAPATAEAPTTSNTNDATNGVEQPILNGSPRVTNLVSKSHFADRVLGAEETDKDIAGLEGYLYKENRRGKNQKRFFAVNNSYLNYYRKRSAHRAGKLKGSINLIDATTICILVRNGKATRRFAIQTRASAENEEVCLFLKAKSKESAQLWVKVLNERRQFWLNPDAAKTPSVPQPGALMDDDDLGWKDRVASDDEEYSDEGFQSARSRESSDDDESLQSPRKRSPKVSIASYSSNSSEDDDSDEEDVRRSRTSSNFVTIADSLPISSQLLTLPHLPWSTRFWSRPEYSDLRIRGPNYLSTKEKAPLSLEPLFECVAVDTFLTDSRVDHICSHPNNRVYQAIQRGEKIPFTFVVNFQVPGPPFYSVVVYFVANHPEIVELLDPNVDPRFELSDAFPPGMKNLLLKFFRTEANKEFLNTHLKLIPRIVEGPWVVRAGIVSKPALIGTKLKNSYHRGDRYFELDINIGTNAMVTKLVQLAISYAKLLTVDLAFLIEGKLVETLPEFIIGMVRCIQIDFKYAVPL